MKQAAIEKASTKLELKEEKLLETIGRIHHRIGERFPKSGLFDLCGDVDEVTRQAIQRAEAIRRPDWQIRVTLCILLVVILAAIIANAPTWNEQISLWKSFIAFMDATKFGAAIITAAFFFLWRWETWLKQRRALKAIHELRALAHVIDMYQLRKTPERIGHPTEPAEVGGKPLTPKDLVHYLSYCTELLAIISKIGHVYVQGFPDKVAVAAVDRFEELATSLSNKIWQKLTILDRMRTELRARTSVRRNKSSADEPEQPRLFD